MKIFDAQSIQFKLLINFAGYDRFHFWVTMLDEDELPPRFDVLQVANSPGEVEVDSQLDSETLGEILHLLSTNADYVHTTYSHQMLVYAHTLAEIILKDYFVSLFVTHPKRMYNYLIIGNDVALKGKVDLKEILEANSKDLLIEQLAQVAANIATGGQIKKVLKNVAEVSNCNVDRQLVDSLSDLAEERNRIVHEGKQSFGEEVRVTEVFQTVADLTYFLASLARQNGVQVKDLGHDVVVARRLSVRSSISE